MYDIFKNIKSDQHLTPINYYAKDFSPDFEMWFHSHCYLEIMYCKTGSFIFEVYKNNEIVYSKTIMTGDFVVITEEIFHKIRILDDPKSTQKVHILNVEFGIDNGIDRFFHVDYNLLIKKSQTLSLFCNTPDGFFVIRDTTGMESVFSELINCLNQSPKTFEDELTIRLLICRFLLLMSKSRTKTEKIGVVYLKRAVEYIGVNFASPITVDDIARVAGVSKSYLQRLFKSYYSTHIHEYICRTRIDYSKMLLKTTQTPLKTIAQNSGFNNHAHFLYEFKKHCGITPTEYRRNITEGYINHNYEHYESSFIVENE